MYDTQNKTVTILRIQVYRYGMDTGVIDDMYSMGAVCEPIRQMAVCVGGGVFMGKEGEEKRRRSWYRTGKAFHWPVPHWSINSVKYSTKWSVGAAAR